MSNCVEIGFVVQVCDATKDGYYSVDRSIKILIMLNQLCN